MRCGLYIKLILSLAAFQYSIDLIGQNLIAHYPFDNSADDKSGNDNNGKIIGGVETSQDRFGNPCGAFFFNGVDGYIEVPSSSSIKSPEKGLTVAFWFYLKKKPSNNGIRNITAVCKGNIQQEEKENPQYRMQLIQFQDKSTVSISSDFTEYDLQFKNHTIEFEKWYHCAMTYDSKNVSVFLNGKMVWDFKYSSPFAPNDLPLFIGKDIPGSTEYFLGSMDDLRIYDYPLKESEILELFNDTSGKIFDNKFNMTCSGNIFKTTQKGDCFSVVNYPDPTIDVNCGQYKLEQIKGLSSNSDFPLGETTIAFRAEEPKGFKQSCSFKVLVEDKEAPEIKCSADTVIYIDENLDQVRFDYKPPIVSDNCKVDTTELISGIKSGEYFSVGITENLFKVTDVSGNSNTCSFKVSILKRSNSVIEEKKAVPPTIINTIIKDTVKYYYDLNFSDCIVTLVMYDDSEQDNDTVSVYYNNKLIVDRQMIKLKSVETIKRVIVINPDEKNNLVVKAWNTGTTSPNTLKIDFYLGNLLKKPNQLKKNKLIEEKLIHSKPGQAGALTVGCKL